MWLTRPLLSLSAQIIKIGSVAALSERGALCFLSWCTASNFWHPSFTTTSPRKASSEFRVARRHRRGRASEWNATHEKLKGRLDLARVGAMGHSFGAFTTMVVCGMRPALDWLEPPVAPGKGLGPDLRDSRIKCGAALSPQGVGEPFFIKESFGSLRVPLLGISGTKDSQQAGQPPENRKDAFALWPKGEHRFVWLENARHLDFTDSSGSGSRALPSASRKDTQPVARAATLAFFDMQLKSKQEAGNRLTAEALSRFLQGEITNVQVLAK